MKQEKIKEVEDKLFQIWRDYKDRVIFSIIDYLRESSQSYVGELLPPIIEVSDIDQYNHILAFDVHAKEELFNTQTFTCEICQIDRKE